MNNHSGSVYPIGFSKVAFEEFRIMLHFSTSHIKQSTFLKGASKAHFVHLSPGIYVAQNRKLWSAQYLLNGFAPPYVVSINLSYLESYSLTSKMAAVHINCQI